MSFLKKLAERTKSVTEDAARKAADAYAAARVSDADREDRYSICHACPHFISVTTTCKKCGCFMAAKTYMSGAECPIGKWHKITIEPQRRNSDSSKDPV